MAERALRRTKERGKILLTGAEKADLGFLVFDTTTAQRIRPEAPEVIRRLFSDPLRYKFLECLHIL